MPKSLRTFMQLGLRQQGIVLHAWCLFVIWQVKITYLPYRIWQSALYKHTEFQDERDAHLRAIKICNLIEKAARHHVVKINCLRRCMVQKQILHTHKINSQLSIGVKKDQGKIAAHCWLVVNNHIINDSNEETSQYVELQRITSNEKNEINSLNGLL